MIISKLKSRYDPTEVPTTCMIRIKRGDKWYEMRPLPSPISHSKRVVERLKRKGRDIKVVWLSGMGLGLDR